MRRKDREITERSQILALIDKCQVMRLGLVDGDKPYVLPLNYGFEDGPDGLTIYFHGAKTGRKTDLIRANPNACFEIDCDTEFVPSDDACEWTTKYASVIGEGRVTILENPDDKRRGFDALMRHLRFPGTPSYPDAVVAKTQVFRLDIDTLSGKRNA